MPKMSDYEKLVSNLTRLTDNSPCSYEEIFKALEEQLKWFKRARKQEHGK